MENKKFECLECGTKFVRKNSLNSHYERVHLSGRKMVKKKKFECFECGARFTRKADVNRHYKNMHLNQDLIHQCTLCGALFYSSHHFNQHKLSHEPTNSEFTILSSAFRKNCIIYRKTYSEKNDNFDKAFYEDEKKMDEILKYEVLVKKSIKASIIFHIEFIKPLDLADGLNPTTYVLCLRTTTSHLCNADEISIFLLNARNNAQERCEDFVENGSGWLFSEILATDIEIGGCKSLNGGCNLLTVSYMKQLRKIKAISTEERSECFFEAIAFHFTKTSAKDSLRKFIEQNIKITIAKPVKVSDVKKFERDNSHLNMKINIMYAEDDDVYPLYVSKNSEAKHKINLLLFKTIIDKKVCYHYSYVKNLNTLLRKSYECKDGSMSYEKGERCPNCLVNFTNKYTLEKHSAACFLNKPQKVILPQDGEKIMFKKYQNKYKVPFIAFLDFEASHNDPENKCESCAKKAVEVCVHKTTIKSNQNPMTYSLLILDHENKVFRRKTYSGEDCVEHLMNFLLTLEEEITLRMSTIAPMKPLTKEQEATKNAAVICHICEKDLGIDRVMDHDHISGAFIAMSHGGCNLNRKVPNFVPIFTHNLEGYDSHFLIHKLKKDARIRNVDGLPHNTERFKTININIFKFLDSMAFLSASLNDLVNNLTKNEQHPFNILDQMDLYPDNTSGENMKKLLLRKGVYPYEFATSINVLKNTKELPEIEKFYSNLTNTTVSEEDYKHGISVFETFKCKNMLEYTELYCATDTALLAEVMLQFREEILQEFGLDCCHYISTPQLAFDCFLYSTKTELELLSDVDKVIFIENSIRGGMSYIAKRYSKAGWHKTADGETNFFTELLFIDGKIYIATILYLKNKMLLYFTANNLYGLAQSKPLPHDDFKWEKKEDFINLVWEDMREDQERGFIIECDLEYPPNLHRDHASFPLAPESLEITNSMLSPYAAGNNNNNNNNNNSSLK
jgi:hypothetical protein